MPAPKFTPRNYFNAAQEHLGLAGQMLRQSSKMLEAYLESTRPDKIWGERVKYSSKRLFEISTMIVALGVQKWQSSNKSQKS